MPNRVSNIEQLLYLEKQAVSSIINNTAGTADVAAADAARISSLSVDNERQQIDTANKVGGRSQDVSVLGRRTAPFEIAADLNPSGTAGTDPDLSVVISSAFGADPTNGSGTVSVTGAVDNGSGLVRVTATAHGLTTGDVVGISGVVGTTEANGGWRVIVVDANDIDLDGSVFVNAYTSDGTVNKANTKWILADAFQPMTLWDFVGLATAEQKVAVNCIPAELTFELGNDVLTMTATGSGGWALSSDGFAAADTEEKAGLTSYPSEPASPVLTGGIITGFIGYCGVDGQNVAEIASATLTFGTGIQIDEQDWNNLLPDGHEADRRRVTLSITIKDSDTTAGKNFKAKALSGTGMAVWLRSGDVVGSMFAWYMPNVQFTPPKRQDGDLSMDTVFEGVARSSAVGVKDELGMWAL